jgi:hypothetical protein
MKKTAFLIVTAVKTSNLTKTNMYLPLKSGYMIRSIGPGSRIQILTLK